LRMILWVELKIYTGKPIEYFLILVEIIKQVVL